MPGPFPNSFREPEEAPSVVNLPTPVSPKTAIALSVSVMTVPLLGGLVLSRWAMAGVQQLGQVTEELFRGDRLPLLKERPEDSRQRP